MFRIFLTIILVIFLSSCRYGDGVGTPFFAFTKIKIPDGTPAFKKGFKDGCTSGVYSRGSEFYRSTTGFRFDGNMIGNSEYVFGHKRGYGVCFYKVGISRDAPTSSSDKFLTPEGYDSTFNAANINSAWGGMFDGLTPAVKGSNTGFDSIFNVWSGGSGGGVFSANPIWAGGSKGQFFGQ